MDGTDSRPVLSRDTRVGDRVHRLLPRLLVSPHGLAARDRHLGPLAAPLRRGRLLRQGLDQWCGRRLASRRLHTLHHRRHPGSHARRDVRNRGWRGDDPHDPGKPRGKQDWQLEPHSIWYPRTSGIWQTVWMERVPAARILRVAFTPNLARWEIGIEAWIDCQRRDGLRLGVKLHSQGQVLASDTYQVF